MSKIHSLSVILFLLFLTKTFSFPSEDSSTVNTTNDNDTEWFLSQQEFENFKKPEMSRQSRVLEPEDPECSGRYLTMYPGDSATIKSHNSFGQTPYPANYLCRWLVLPNNCELNLVCSLGTRKDEARSIPFDAGFERQNCLNNDYFRVMGYKGAMDAIYCGDEKLSLKVAAFKPLALIFQSKGRLDSPYGEEMRQGLFDLLGFNCNVMCQGDLDPTSSPSPTNTTTTTTTTPSTTTTTNEAAAAEDIILVENSIVPEEAVKTSNLETSNQSGDCICGELRQARIVCPLGDNCTAGVGSMPWQAGLVYKGSWQPWCGASIISDSYLLTAAHCVHNKQFQKIDVILSDHDWTTRHDPTEEVRKQIEKIIKHPYFGARANFDYDFALIKIREPITFSDFPMIRPICLPEFAKTDSDLVGLSGSVSGWGTIDPSKPSKQASQLQRVRVKVMPTSDCETLYKDTSKITDTMMCASGFTGKNPELGGLADACFGDSGGPFTIRQQGREILEGVISWGRSCGKPQWPGVYAKVGRALNWIHQNTQDSKFCVPDLD